jgi:hypothetical protein
MTIEEARAIIGAEGEPCKSEIHELIEAGRVILAAYTKLQELYEHSEWLRNRGGGYPRL